MLSYRIRFLLCAVLLAGCARSLATLVVASRKPPTPVSSATPFARPVPPSTEPAETTVSPTGTPALATVTPTQEPLRIIAGTLSPLSQQTLKEFPLGMANSWVYEYRAYDGDRKTTWQVADTVIEVRVQPPYIAAHVQRETSLITGPRELQPQPLPGSFWYVVEGEAVYRVDGDLDWNRIHAGALELVFPLPGDRCWFPDAQQRAQPYSPDLPGCRGATGPVSLRLPAGSFDRCYQLVTPYNNGGIRQAFCSGVGFVQEQFDHVGTPFGYQMTLIAYAFQ